MDFLRSKYSTNFPLICAFHYIARAQLVAVSNHAPAPPRLFHRARTRAEFFIVYEEHFAPGGSRQRDGRCWYSSAGAAKNFAATHAPRVVMMNGGMGGRILISCFLLRGEWNVG